MTASGVGSLPRGVAGGVAVGVAGGGVGGVGQKGAMCCGSRQLQCCWRQEGTHLYCPGEGTHLCCPGEAAGALAAPRGTCTSAWGSPHCPGAPDVGLRY